MDAELTGIARRFVACPKWVWLVGMAYVSTDPDDKMRRGRLGLAPDGGDCFRCVEDWYHGDEAEERNPDDFEGLGWVPDLDDETTRAAMLPAIRKAWNDPHAFVRFFNRAPLEGHWFWECGAGSRRQCGFVADVKHGELLALLAALESAK